MKALTGDALSLVPLVFARGRLFLWASKEMNVKENIWHKT
jgi:hypothetical protein